MSFHSPTYTSNFCGNLGQRSCEILFSNLSFICTMCFRVTEVVSIVFTIFCDEKCSH